MKLFACVAAAASLAFFAGNRIGLAGARSANDAAARAKFEMGQAMDVAGSFKQAFDQMAKANSILESANAKNEKTIKSCFDILRTKQ